MFGWLTNSNTDEIREAKREQCKEIREKYPIGIKIEYLGREVTVTDYDNNIIGMHIHVRRPGIWVEWFDDFGRHNEIFLNYYKTKELTETI